MALAAVAADVAQAGDVLGHRPAERAFHHVVGLNDVGDVRELIFRQLVGPGLAIDVRLLENHLGIGGTHAVDVPEGDTDGLVVGDVDAGDTGHKRLLRRSGRERPSGAGRA